MFNLLPCKQIKKHFSDQFTSQFNQKPVYNQFLPYTVTFSKSSVYMVARVAFKLHLGQDLPAKRATDLV